MLELVGNPNFDEVDPVTGETTSWRYDPVNKRMSVTVKVPPGLDKRILTNNETRYANSDKSFKGNWHEVANIPKLAWFNYCQARGIDPDVLVSDRSELKKFLNDYENRQFRVKKGRI